MNNLPDIITNFFSFSRINKIGLSDELTLVYKVGIYLIALAIIIIVCKVLIFPILVFSKIPLMMALISVICGYGIHIYMMGEASRASKQNDDDSDI